MNKMLLKYNKQWNIHVLNKARYNCKHSYNWETNVEQVLDQTQAK